MKTRINTDTVHRALARIIATANGGTFPDKLDLVISDRDGLRICSAGRTDGRSILRVAIGAEGALTVDVGIATHWTKLRHPGFRFARTPGGQLCLLGRHGGRAMHFWFEDGLFCDHGSPLMSAALDAEAIAAFDREFAALGVEVA